MANSDRTHLAGYLETPQVHFWPAPAQMAFSAGTTSSRNVRFRQRAYVPPLPKHDINTHTHIENRTLTCTDLHHLATSPTTTTHPRGSLDLGNRMEQLRNLSELYFLSLCFKHTKNTHFPIHSPIGPLLNSIFTLSSNRHMKPLQGVRAWSRTNLLVGVGGVEEQCIALYQASPCTSDTHFDIQSTCTFGTDFRLFSCSWSAISPNPEKAVHVTSLSSMQVDTAIFTSPSHSLFCCLDRLLQNGL